MAKLVNKVKDNPKLEQRLLGDGQISLYLEYYLGRVSEPVIDDNGNPVLYESGKMKGTPKYKVKHIRRKEKLSLYLIATPKTPIDRNHNKETLQLAKQIRSCNTDALYIQEIIVTTSAEDSSFHQASIVYQAMYSLWSFFYHSRRKLLQYLFVGNISCKAINIHLFGT